MKFQGFRIPDGMIADMNYINHETGMSKSQMVRNGLQLIINDYFMKEKVKNEQIELHKQRKTNNSEGWFKLPDEW